MANVVWIIFGLIELYIYAKFWVFDASIMLHHIYTQLKGSTFIYS